MILRNKDGDTAWTSASDGTLEERLYYMHNWRHDVSLVVTSGARIVEYAKYYSYGRPFGMPAGDCDSFGSNTANDFQVLLNWIAASAWDARGDVNTDGTVNMTDGGLFASEFMGTGVLSRSDVMNRTGYASYQHAPDLAGTKYHVRHRVLDSDLGRWTRRDPLGYVDGMGLYEYVSTRPVIGSDPSGLAWHVAEPCQTDVDPESFCGKKCRENPGTWGRTQWDDNCRFDFCCICLSTVMKWLGPKPPIKVVNSIVQCVKAHEHLHIAEGCRPPGGEACSECRAYGVEANCLLRALQECLGREWYLDPEARIRPNCRALEARVTEVLKLRLYFCAKCLVNVAHE